MEMSSSQLDLVNFTARRGQVYSLKLSSPHLGDVKVAAGTYQLRSLEMSRSQRDQNVDAPSQPHSLEMSSSQLENVTFGARKRQVHNWKRSIPEHGDVKLTA